MGIIHGGFSQCFKGSGGILVAFVNVLITSLNLRKLLIIVVLNSLAHVDAVFPTLKAMLWES